MKYFLDTEFIEGFSKPLIGKNRHFIDLISIGIVCEDGREYYAISNEWRYKDASPWLRENVIKKLDSEADLKYKSNGRIADEARTFFGCWRDQHFWRAPSHPIEIYGYYADYDWVLFCSLFGRMIDLPSGFPMSCVDLKQMMDERSLVNEWKSEHCPDPEGEHNALVDAKWNLKLYKAICDWSKSYGNLTH